MDILNNIGNILKHKFLIFSMLLIVFSLVATEVAEAKTITSSVTFADTTRLDYFENLYNRSGYDYYLLAIENTSSGYTNYNYYYLCLTDTYFEINDQLNASATCDEMYLYYRNDNGDYILEKSNETELIVNNSVYYKSNVVENNYILNTMSVAIFIVLTCYFFYKWIIDLWCRYD